MWRMPRTAPPPGFEESREATPAELDSLPSIGHVAVHVLEACIAEHHVAEIEYTEPDGSRKAIRLRPAFIRYNRAHHVVVWGFPDAGDNWIELRLDRIHGVRDTGDVFEPTW
jgi:hypothetical protein